MKQLVLLVSKLGLHLEEFRLEHDLFSDILGRDAVQLLILLNTGLGGIDGVLDLNDGVVSLPDVINNRNALFAQFLRCLLD